LGETVRYLDTYLFLDDEYLFGYECYDEKYVYNGLLCMRDIIHEWWMMDIVGT